MAQVLEQLKYFGGGFTLVKRAWPLFDFLAQRSHLPLLSTGKIVLSLRSVTLFFLLFKSHKLSFTVTLYFPLLNALIKFGVTIAISFTFTQT